MPDRRAVAVLALAVGCGQSSPSTSTMMAPPAAAVMVRFDPAPARDGDAASRWLAFPFPSDHRRSARGTIRLDDFPNPEGLPLIDRYIAVAEADVDGASTCGAVHLAFSGPLDPSSLPASPSEYADAAAPLQLVDITAGSPEYGRRRPLRFELRTARGRYAAANSLAVAPAWGFPMRERSTYALLLTDGVRAQDGRPLGQPPLLRALLADAATAPPDVQPAVEPALYEALRQRFAALRSLLAQDGIMPSRIVAATVFSTQGTTAALRAIHRQVTTELPAPPLREDAFRPPLDAEEGALFVERSFQWSSRDTASYFMLEGAYRSPNYQLGEPPYADEGGKLQFVDGAPRPVRWEELRFVLTLPKEPPRGGACYPIVEFSHGTGGSAYSAVSKDIAGRLAGRGLASISIDQPLHGARAEGKAFDINLLTFNYLNPDSARAGLAQSAIDTFVLTRFVRESLRVPASASPSGREICFDPQRVLFFGHSQGGLAGALAAAFERHLGAWVLSGAGGGATVTMMERKDPFDVARLVGELLRLDLDEPLTDLHPVATLVQTLVEVTDPAVYSPYWSDAAPGAPPSLLVTSGRHDAATPYRTATIMALAGRVPIVAPVAIPVPEYGWAGIAPASAPLSGNLDGHTAGFLQWTDDLPGKNYDTHQVIFYRPEAINASLRFLETAASDGKPIIERIPDADVR